jgi:hypothetical protein
LFGDVSYVKDLLVKFASIEVLSGVVLFSEVLSVVVSFSDVLLGEVCLVPYSIDSSLMHYLTSVSSII